MGWKRILAYITGSVNEELLLRNEYLVAENHIHRKQINGRLILTDGERITLAEIANIVRPETILAWYRKLIAKKFDGSKNRKKHCRPRIDKEIEEQILLCAADNPTWGYADVRIIITIHNFVLVIGL